MSIRVPDCMKAALPGLYPGGIITNLFNEPVAIGNYHSPFNWDTYIAWREWNCDRCRKSLDLLRAAKDPNYLRGDQKFPCDIEYALVDWSVMGFEIPMEILSRMGMSTRTISTCSDLDLREKDYRIVIECPLCGHTQVVEKDMYLFSLKGHPYTCPGECCPSHTELQFKAILEEG